MLEIEEVVERYGDYLLRIAYLYVKNQATAEDIVQDVFITYYEKQAQYRGESSLKTYLVRITVNRCHDYLRSWKYKSLVLFEKVRGKQNHMTPERHVIETVEKHDLIEALFTLSIHYREVILLYYYEELSTGEIANLLNCPESTIRTRLQRARKQLKNRMIDYEWEVFRDESF